MNYNFVKVDKKTRAMWVGSPFIRIDCYNGVLSLGVEFCKNNNIKDFKFVYLFCDKVEKVIAIKFLREQAEGSYKISTLKNFKNPKIVSSIALQYMDLKSKEKKSIKIIPEKIEDKNLGTLFLLKI